MLSEYGLEIPERPDGTEPELKPGWHWVNVHWLAYWMMTGNNPITEERRREEPYPESLLVVQMETLRWWQSDKLGNRVFEKILTTPNPAAAEEALEKWIVEFGLQEVAAVVIAEDPVMAIKEITRGDVLAFYTCHRYAVWFNIARRSFGQGRHRVYAAWKQNVEEVFAFLD
jgi:hypothetical protein